MERCLTCNGILRKGEATCFTCGGKTPKTVRGTSMAKRFAVVITVIFIGSLLLTAASFFSDHTPPFAACLASSVILLFVKRTADSTSGRKP
jgi:hypothetical protein